ncbi:MAG: glycosyltransferase family 2 protein [Promethearchaeota archaeon]
MIDLKGRIYKENPMFDEKEILIIIPVYNEEGKIASVLKRLFFEGFRNILIVNDGSTDHTLQVIKKYNVNVISYQHNKGVGFALKAGLEYAVKHDYKIIVIMGGDDQDDPKEIYDLIKPIIYDKVDFVQGSRYLKNKHRTFPSKLIETKIFSFVFSIIARRRVTDASNGFRAINLRKCKSNIERLVKINYFNGYEFEPFLLLELIKNGYVFKEVHVNKYYNIKKGYSKMRPIISWIEIVIPLFFFPIFHKKLLRGQ